MLLSTFFFALPWCVSYCEKEMEEKPGFRWIWLEQNTFAEQAFPLTDTDKNIIMQVHNIISSDLGYHVMQISVYAYFLATCIGVSI